MPADQWLFKALVQAALHAPEGCVWKSGRVLGAGPCDHKGSQPHWERALPGLPLEFLCTHKAEFIESPWRLPGGKFLLSNEERRLGSTPFWLSFPACRSDCIRVPNVGQFPRALGQGVGAFADHLHLRSTIRSTRQAWSLSCASELRNQSANAIVGVLERNNTESEAGKALGAFPCFGACRCCL